MCILFSGFLPRKEHPLLLPAAACDWRCVIAQLLCLYWGLLRKEGALPNQRDDFSSSQHGAQQGLSTIPRLSTKSGVCFFALKLQHV